jgi:glycosyltransferase involved in cell wall biosynthesis
MPFYCRKAAAILSVSQLTTDHFNRILGLPMGKVRTVYFGPARHFRRVEDESKLSEIRSRYQLPSRFILTLTKYGDGNRKNFSQILEAYRRFHGRTEHKLVVGGKDCVRFRTDYCIPDTGWGSDVLFPGWIDQQDLPAFYSLADLYLYPSNLEAFPIPVTEAMACGTAILTSNVNGLEEIAGDATLLVDPSDAEQITSAMVKVLTDPALQETLSKRALARSSRFTWGSCARETLKVIESLALAPVK